jgi:hypothetical protein
VTATAQVTVDELDDFSLRGTVEAKIEAGIVCREARATLDPTPPGR